MPDVITTERVPVEERDYQAIVSWLMMFAVGPEHTKTRAQIEVAFAYPPGGLDRAMRRIIGIANSHGVPLASSDDGYFVATAREHFEPMLARLRHQRDTLHNRVLTIERLRANL